MSNIVTSKIELGKTCHIMILPNVEPVTDDAHQIFNYLDDNCIAFYFGEDAQGVTFRIYVEPAEAIPAFIVNDIAHFVAPVEFLQKGTVR